MTLILKLLGMCPHFDYTFPQTINGRCYVACTSCGAEHDYDWKNMGLAK